MRELSRTTRLGYFPPSSRFFGGGGSTAPAPSAPPITNTPAPAVAAPATASAAEVVQAQQDARRQALKKKGFSRTVFAGDTGGWSGAAPSPTNPMGGTPPGGPGAKTLGS